MPPQGISESQMAEFLFPPTNLNLSQVNITQFSLEQYFDNELCHYLSPLNSAKPVDPHQWWKENIAKMPKLGKLANKFLSCPPSSVESERTFSIGGNTYTPKRSKLLPENSSKMIELAFNMRHFNDMEID